MSYTITAGTLEAINLAPATKLEEVMQNVAMIISTPKYSVPLARGFGLTQQFLDKPITTAKAIAVAEIMDAIEEYEPRAEIKSITFEQDGKEGRLVPIVELEVKEDG